MNTFGLFLIVGFVFDRVCVLCSMFVVCVVIRVGVVCSVLFFCIVDKL